ncbi:hypothetical protein ACLOJK_025330 [Asimina triloba]
MARGLDNCDIEIGSSVVSNLGDPNARLIFHRSDCFLNHVQRHNLSSEPLLSLKSPPNRKESKNPTFQKLQPISTSIQFPSPRKEPKRQFYQQKGKEGERMKARKYIGH